MNAREPSVSVRMAGPGDARLAEDAARLIDEAAREHDIARRDPAMLREKIEHGRAALALDKDRLVGFGYFAEWEGGRFVSHSGLVVDPAYQGLGIGRKLKEALLQASERELPDAATISLTTSDAVFALNRSLGFEPCSFDEMTTDPAFWAGCRTCRNYEDVRSRGLRCCCRGMIRRPKRSRREP